MIARFPICLAACFITCIAIRAVSAESMPSAPAAWRLSPESIGKLPDGWTATRGTWKVCADSNAEVFKPLVGLDWTGVCDDQLGRALALAPARDTGGGAIETTDRAIADFDVTFRWKFYAERGYWADEFRFRIQERDRRIFYALTRERSGKISLAKVSSAKERAVLQSTPRAFAQQRGEWLWMRVIAVGNRFRVNISADGAEWTPAIDVVDSQSGFSRGALGFGIQSTTMIVPEGVTDLGSSGARLETITQSRTFRADDARHTRYRLDLAIRGASTDRAPTTLSVTGAPEPINVPLSGLRAGVNHLSLWIPVPTTGRETPIEVALKAGEVTIDRAAVRVVDVLGRSQFKPGNATASVPTTTPSPPAAITRQTYLELVERIHARYGAVGGRFGWDARFGDAAQLHRATHDAKYLDNTLAWVRQWLDDRAKGVADFPPQNFAQRYAFAVACEVALQSGRLDASEQSSLRALITDFIVREQTEAGGVINRTLGYVLAYPVLLRCVPDFPLRREVTTYIDRFKQDVNKHAEGLENSTNYLPITMMFFVLWIDDVQPELWKDARIREGFENLLQLITPGGAVPMFGDYGGTQQHTFMLVAVLERLAVVYHDGRFKWAAQTMARRCIEDFALERVNGWDSQGLALAVSWTDDSIVPKPPTNGSALLKRTDGHLDKLVLRSGWGPEDRQVMIDLLNGCEHGDNGALSIVSISRGTRQSLLDKAGRGIGFHSLPLVRDRGDDIPYRLRQVELGAWRYACFDLPLYWSWGNFSGGIGSPMMHQFSYGQGLLPYDFTYDPTREFSFAVNILGSGRGTVSIDDVKLVKRGPTPDRPAAQRVLEDFDGEPRQWIGDGERSDRGGRAGRGRFGRFDVNFDNGGWIGRKFPMPLNLGAGDWNQIEFWYKLDSDAGDAARLAPWTLTIGDRLGYPHNYLFHHNPSYPVTIKTMSDTPLATFASLQIDERDDQGRPQKRERQIVFVKRNGVVWVRDVITLHRDDDREAWAAGPVWQLAQLGAQRGPNWVDTWLDDNLLIWCLPRSGRKHALVHQPTESIWGHGIQDDLPLSFQQIAEGRGSVKEGELMFDSVLVPHESSVSASTLANSIRVVRDEGGVTAIEVDGDLLVANRTGGQVTIGNVKTDCRWAFLQRDLQGNLEAGTSEGGTGIVRE